MKKGGRRVNVNQEAEDSSSSTDDEDAHVVLHIDEEEGQATAAKPYTMTGTLAGNKFTTMIDSGSPVTIFNRCEKYPSD